MDYTVELKNINKIYPGVQALNNVNFNVSPGQIRCLVGENGSGKSTMIKILSGVEVPEPGSQIYIDGQIQTHHSCESALQSGIQVIYQDISLFPNLTIAENIAFRNYTNSKNSLVNWKQIEQVSIEALQKIGFDTDIKTKVGQLSIAQQQLVEVARSLTGNLKLLILDEPTSSLTRKEVNALFDAIQKLKSRNIAVLFVSHKLNEIFEIAEKVSVLKDGVMVGEYDPGELDQNKLTHLMTGKQELNIKPAPLSDSAPVLLKIENLSKKDNYKDINLQLSQGEILGITGLLGSGRTELALSLFGMNKPDSGEIWIEGQKIAITSQVKAIAKGIAYVPENRRDDGIIQEQNIEENISIITLKKYLNRWKFLDLNRRVADIQKSVKDLNIKVSHLDALAKTLSGGNQQKIVLAKWLATDPKLLILDEPTVGIDVIAKSNIHQIMKNMAELGMGIIMISDEVQEVINNCHRVLVMDSGRIVHEFFPGEASESELLEKYNLA